MLLAKLTDDVYNSLLVKQKNNPKRSNETHKNEVNNA